MSPIWQQLYLSFWTYIFLSTHPSVGLETRIYQDSDLGHLNLVRDLKYPPLLEDCRPTMRPNPVAENVLGTMGELFSLLFRTHDECLTLTTCDYEGTICWTGQLIPQVWKNYRDKKTFGLSPWLMSVLSPFGFTHPCSLASLFTKFSYFHVTG